jgi:hypothetical protein
MILFGLISFLFITALFIYYTKPGLISISVLYITYCFFFFFLALILFLFFPSYNSYYDQVVKLKSENKAILTNSFFKFLIFYTAFLLMYSIMQKIKLRKEGLFLKNIESIIFKKKKEILHFSTVLTPLLILLNFFFRKHFLVGVPTIEPSIWKPAEYLWYFFDYGSIILLIFSIILSISAEKKRLFLLNSLYFLLYAITQFLLGWKGPIIFSVFAFVTLNTLYFKRLKIKLRYIFLVTSIFVSFFFISLSSYHHFRDMALKGKPLSTITSINIIKNSLPSAQNYQSSIQYLVNRFVGVNIFAPINFFLDKEEPNISMFDNLFTRGSTFPERYLTEQLFHDGRVGVNTTEAITIYGALKTYGNDWGLLWGGLIIGLIFGLSQYMFNPYEKLDQTLSTTIYIMVLVYIFPQIIFEGNFIFFLKRNVLTIIFLFFGLALSIKAYHSIINSNKHVQ